MSNPGRSQAITLLNSLLGSSPSIALLTPIESRLNRLAVEAMSNTLIMLRMNPDSPGSLHDMTPEMFAQAGKLALAWAVSIDEDLRTLRVNLEARRDGSS